MRFIIDDTVDTKINIHTKGDVNEVCDYFQSILEDKGYIAVPEGDLIRIAK